MCFVGPGGLVTAPPGGFDCPARNRVNRYCVINGKRTAWRSQVDLKREVVERPDTQIARAALPVLMSSAFFA
jgi:hypothetical protein